jgi:DNA-binding FadR family transcriptional regulator
MIGFHERAVGFLGNVPQMGKLDVVGEALRHRRHIVGLSRAERFRAESEAVRRRRASPDDEGEIVHGADDIKEVFDARFVREAVELAVVRRACAEMTASAIDNLRANLKAQRAVADNPHPERFMELDEAFHRGIALGVGCEYAWRVVEETKAQMDRVRYLSLPNATPVERLIAQHEAIVDGIEARDPDRAEAAMRRHLREFLTSLPEPAQRFPDFFEQDMMPAAHSAEAV